MSSYMGQLKALEILKINGIQELNAFKSWLQTFVNKMTSMKDDRQVK
jgi:hypothetical protein